jgi:hypothetical protein
VRGVRGGRGVRGVRGVRGGRGERGENRGGDGHSSVVSSRQQSLGLSKSTKITNAMRMAGWPNQTLKDAGVFNAMQRCLRMSTAYCCCLQVDFILFVMEQKIL